MPKTKNPYRNLRLLLHLSTIALAESKRFLPTIQEYNYNRPHETLGNLTPIEWKEKVLNNPVSTVLTV